MIALAFVISLAWLIFGIWVMEVEAPPVSIKQWIVVLFVGGPFGCAIIAAYLILQMLNNKITKYYRNN
jgi:hypothetical protein